MFSPKTGRQQLAPGNGKLLVVFAGLLVTTFGRRLRLGALSPIGQLLAWVQHLLCACVSTGHTVPMCVQTPPHRLSMPTVQCCS